MRLFFVVKTAQMISSYIIIALLLGTYHLCGKASLDRVLSHPNSSCMQFIQRPFLSNTLQQNERNNIPQEINTTAILQEYENISTDPLVNGKNVDGGGGVNYEEMTDVRGILESYSCIEIDLRDLSCFLWKTPGSNTPCQAASGMTFPPIVVALDLLFLIYTMISVSRRVLPSSKATDFIRCVIHIMMWCTVSISKVYLMYTWEHAWKYIDFQAKIPMQSYMALIFSVANVIIYCAEIFYSKWLYMRIRLITKPDKTKEPYEGTRLAIQTSNRAPLAGHPLKTRKKPEEHLLIPRSRNL